jgi:hypothetical protein
MEDLVLMALFGDRGAPPWFAVVFPVLQALAVLCVGGLLALLLGSLLNR